MKKKILHIAILFVGLVFLPIVFYAQEVGEASTDSSKVQIKNSDFFEFRGDLDPPEQHFKGNVKMVHDSIFMFSDSAFVAESLVTAVGEVVILQEDTIRLFADSLLYDSENYRAKLFDEVVLENGSQQLFTDRLDYNLNTKVAVYPDTAILRNKRTKLSSLWGKYDVNTNKATFVGSVVVIDKEFTLYTDSLIYDTNLDKAIFVAPTRIIQKDRTILCDRGFYDIPNENALFEGNASFVENDKNAMADRIRYDGKSNTVYLEGNAVYKDGEKLAKAINMTYEEDKKNIILQGNAFFDDGGSVATGETIRYNENTEQVSIDGKAELDSDESSIDADNLSFDDKTGIGKFKGNVVYENKKDSLSIFSDFLEIDDKNKSYKSYGETTRPYMLRFLGKDSLFLSADTLHVQERVDSLDTIEVFKAFKDVRILSDEFQALADSLYYDSKDSLFVLFRNPIMWSDSSQFVADTIKIRLGDDGVEKVYLNQKGMITELIQDKYYNQLSAKYIVAEIDSNDISFMEMKQNAESNYFILDDKDAFVGLNHTLCSSMDFYFEGGELTDIKFFQQPTSKLTPIQQLTAAQLYLDGFKWEEELKPKSLNDLLAVKEKEALILPVENNEESEASKVIEEKDGKSKVEPKNKKAGKRKN